MKYAVVAASLFAAVFAQGPAYGGNPTTPAYTPTEPAYTPQSIPPYNTGYTPSGGPPGYPTGGWGAPSYPTTTPSTPATSTPTWGPPQYPTTSPTGWGTNPGWSTNPGWGTSTPSTPTTPATPTTPVWGSTNTPSGSWKTSPTQPAYSSSTWVPPTGAGEKVQAAGLLMGAGALVALFL